jgi:hypothetical protein
MSAFNDTRCKKCSKKIGWIGAMKDHPPCPRCGYRPSPEALAVDEQAMEEFRAMLR